jgi:DNA primase
MSVWEDIKNQLNIVDVINDYVPVKQLGSSYKCLCPFHKDKNPSLTISPEKGLWHCFGCGAGGDAFKFVMDFENIDRKHALQRLAKKAGIELKKYSQPKNIPTIDGQVADAPETISDFDLGLKYLDWVSQIYHKLLQKSLLDRDNLIAKYCIERGLSQEIIDKFQLGYAPKNNFIFQLASKHKLNLEILAQIGILKISPEASGGYKDKFSDRLMIPVFDRNGHTVGFTGRILPYDQSGRPKYLNSSQSQWFNKSGIWYGWHLNQKSIRQSKKVIIVEGNMDVISASSIGVDFTLASQGTSFTAEQLKSLKFITTNVWLAFDNDEAGISAGRKFFVEATQAGLSVDKLIIPKNYKDLDEYLKSLSKEKPILDQLKTTSYLDYEISENDFDLRNGDIKLQKQTTDKILELVQHVDTFEQEHYLQKLSQITQKSRNAILSEFSKIKNKQAQNSRFNTPQQLETSDKDFTNSDPRINLVLVNFQNYLSLVLSQNFFNFDELGSDQANKSRLIFNLLKGLLSQLASFETIQDYVNENIEILKLIAEEKTGLDEVKLYQILSQFIDENYTSVLLDEELTDSYLQLKKLNSSI